MVFHRLTLDGTVTPLTQIHSALTEECSGLRPKIGRGRDNNPRTAEVGDELKSSAYLDAKEGGRVHLLQRVK